MLGSGMPCSFEALLLGLAEKLGLAGYGSDAFGPGKPLIRAEDYYLKMVANIAHEGSMVPDASEEENEIFLRARRHLKPEIFDVERWKKAVDPQHWPKVIYLLNRGGRFEDYTKAYKGNQHAHPYDKLLSLYSEKIAKIKNAFTGKPYQGYPCYVPLADSLGRSLEAMENGFPFTLLTHRVVAMTKSRTISNYWLLALAPENGILMNPRDANTHGFSDGAKVRVTSHSNPDGSWDLGPGGKKPMVGKIKLTETIQPGCISFALGFGHWAVGSSDMIIDGKKIKADKRRAFGVHANAAMCLDPYLKNTCLLDPIGGSASFYDTKVKLIPV